MESYSALKIAEIVGGSILHGDGNRLVSNVSTNSKEGNTTTLFVPIIGERVDAHNFIQDAYKNGMRVTFTMRDYIEEQTEDMTYIKVTHTLDALQQFAAYYREQFTLPIIGITGSVGKTTTKEMIAAALSVKYNVLKTSGNMNSQVGLPQMMLKIEREHDIAVIEMGMSLPGEMERLAKVAKPDLAVITNIGVSHIGQLGSKENIREAKLNIINEFNEGAMLFVNGEDELLKEVYDSCKENKSSTDFTQKQLKIKVSSETRKALETANVKAFGLQDGFEFYAKNIQNIGEQTFFNFCFLDSRGRMIEEEIILNVLGTHNVLNAVVALAVAYTYGISPKDAKEGLFLYRPISMRGQIERLQGITLVDDTYNASPDSMKSAVDVLLALPDAKRRIAVFADILELGEMSRECHYGVGTYLSKTSVDLVVTIGKEANYINEAIHEKNDKIESINFLENESAANYLLSELNHGDCIILKGSRGMHLDEIVGKIKEKFQK